MKSKKLWIILIVIIVLIGAGLTFTSDLVGLISQAAGNSGATNTALVSETTPIRSASSRNEVSAAGNIAVVKEYPVVFQVAGTVMAVMVEAGDQISSGDVLVRLNTTDLERAVAQAELSLADSQAQLDQLLEPADAAEIVSAQADLASAQENLLEVQAGPSETELVAAEASLAAAEAKYDELLEGIDEAERIQLAADLRKAEIELQQAQWDYDKIAYSDSIGSSPQAAALQQATITYEATKAAYDIAVKPASQAELHEALSAIRSAEDQLETLRTQPTPAELASAEGQVVNIAAQLEALLASPSEAEIRIAEIRVDQARLTLEAAQADLAQAQLIAPIDGTILAVDVSVGENVTSGFVAVTISDLNALELTVNVAEVDVSKIETGQMAEITIDALPDQTFSGAVTQIAPASDSEQGVVNYPVTIQLSNVDLTGVRPGMTAVASLLTRESEIGWFVPTAALQEQDSETVVMISRGGQVVPVPVIVQGSQGEWTIVQSPDLQAGDQAIGSVTTFVNEEDTGGGFSPMGGGRPPN